MTECEEVAAVLAKAYRDKVGEHGGSVHGARSFVRDQMRHESYNVIDQVEAAVDKLLWPNVRTQDIPRYF